MGDLEGKLGLLRATIGPDTPRPDWARANETFSVLEVGVGLYPIVTFQYSSTTSYQVSYHIRYLFF